MPGNTPKELGNISDYDETKFREVIQEKYYYKNKGLKTWTFNSMWHFWHDIKVGDIIIARKGILGLVSDPNTKVIVRVQKKTKSYVNNQFETSTVGWILKHCEERK